MIAGLFWGLSVATIVIIVQHIIIKKEWFSIYAYLLVGVYVPLFMSFLDWSAYHIVNRSENFYFIFIMLDIACLISLTIPQKAVACTNIEFKKNSKSIPVEVLDFLYVGCILLENYTVSGYLIPRLHGVDVHTARMSGIYFITTGVFIFTILNVLEFISTGKKRYLIYAVFVFVFNTVTKSARIDAALAIVQIISFVMFYCLSKRKTIKTDNGLKTKKKNQIPLMFAVGLLAVILISVGIRIGNNRMNSFGKYQTVYAEGISYTGPEFFGETLTYYYGYFGLSFDNLAYNVSNVEVHPNYTGLNSFRALYFGILQFDNFFGLNGSEAPRSNIIRCRGAAVTTGFWDFYYDYGMLIIIPFLVSFLIAIALRKKIANRNLRVVNLILYFYWIPLWLFMSFDNRVYDYQVIWQVLMIFFIFYNRYSITFDEIRSNSEKTRYTEKRHSRRRILIIWRRKW